MTFLELLKELDNLKLPLGKYALTSSSTLAVRGLREAQDLDVLIT